MLKYLKKKLISSSIILIKLHKVIHHLALRLGRIFLIHKNLWTDDMSNNINSLLVTL